VTTARYRVTAFRRWHLDWLGPEAEGGDFQLPLEAARELELSGLCQTVLYEDAPIACGGLAQIWPHRYQAWMLLDRRTGRHMPWITKQVSAYLQKVVGRVELTVRADFPQGQRWARMLWFELETPLLRQYGHDGADHVGYVRINGG